MTPEHRITMLERELIETRNAAARMVATIVRRLIATEEGRAEVVGAMMEMARDPEVDPVEARLARLVAAAVRG